MDTLYNKEQIASIASAVKVLSAEAVERAKSGHPGTPIGASEIISCLFVNFLNFNPKDPLWINRDRFILSAGHSAAMLYSMLHLFGYKQFTTESLKNLRRLNYITSGHPEIEQQAGLEVTTGPLGEGIGMGVGIALASKIMAERYGKIINYRTYVFAGDGCFMEGVSYEALSLAGNLGLNNLIVIYDNNNITIDGNLSLASSEDVLKRMEAFGFLVLSIDGHDISAINTALKQAQSANKPVFIMAKTKIAHQAGEKEGTSSSHGSPLGNKAIEELKKNLNWHNDAFIVPQEVKDLCVEITSDKIIKYDIWQKKFETHKEKAKITKFLQKDLPLEFFNDLNNFIQDEITKEQNIATRVASSKVLNVMIKHIPNIIGGSADLSGSNGTITENSLAIGKDQYSGNYIYYGVREHAMAAVMNGLSCSGFTPYGGTFLIFSDFLRPALRLSALMGRAVIYVLTHDSISLGGDGPTHQPIEHLESLKLIPNLKLFRPADIVEVAESYLLALQSSQTPSVISLGRSEVPLLRKEYNPKNNKVALGAYIIKESESVADIVMLSSGSEVYLTLEAADILEQQHGMSVRVVSCPCLSAFMQQSAQYKQSVLGQPKVSVVVEAAAIGGSWYKLGLQNPLYYGIDSFGASGLPNEVMEHFGFSGEKIASAVLSMILKESK